MAHVPSWIQRRRRSRSSPARYIVRVVVLCACLCLTLAVPSTAQSSPSGDDAMSASVRAGVQDVYDRMTRSYELLDLEMVAQLYTEDASYILPSPEAEVLKGRERIQETFRGFFESIEDNDASLRIDFRFVTRKVYGDVAHDIGYYRVTTSKDGAVRSQSTGKFATVIEKGNDGVWRFAVDAYSSAPDAAYNVLGPGSEEAASATD